MSVGRVPSVRQSAPRSEPFIVLEEGTGNSRYSHSVIRDFVSHPCYSSISILSQMRSSGSEFFLTYVANTRYQFIGPSEFTEIVISNCTFGHIGYFYAHCRCFCFWATSLLVPVSSAGQHVPWIRACVRCCLPALWFFCCEWCLCAFPWVFIAKLTPPLLWRDTASVCPDRHSIACPFIFA